jgi:hypothetical protein
MFYKLHTTWIIKIAIFAFIDRPGSLKKCLARYQEETPKIDPPYSGVQCINNVYAIVNKVENVCVNKYIFDLIDNGVYVVYALYSSTAQYFL